ncbi:helix-turn-helix domain-containing protein [Streptococcus suis]|nr:helix-turn-helix domain-containing protein [Streptococcus suis]
MNRLKELRKEKKLSQKEIAKKLSFPLRTYQRMENGESQIKPDKAEKLADYFGVSVGFLLGFGTVEEELQQNRKETISQWKKESDTLLSLGFVLSDNDIDVLSHLLHNMSSRNSAYFFTLVEHNDKFIVEQLESEFSAFYEKNPDYVINTKKEYADYLRRSTDPEEIRKRDERLKLIQEFQEQKN